MSLFMLFMLCSLFLMMSSSLLLVLVLLEIIVFFLLFFVMGSIYSSMVSSFLLLILFSVFVMESVIALSALITLVSFTGTDYISSKSFTLL